MKLKSQRALIVFLLMPFVYSCSSYNSLMSDYSANLKNASFVHAIGNIEQNKLLKKQRNKLLYNFELGRLYYLTNNEALSNQYLNEADDMLESNFKSVKEVALSNLTNPMMENYRGEDFECFMLNFYKAINYLSLGKTDETVVEARRITLSNDRLSVKKKDNENKYYQDAFALNVQGMIYESAGDYNNAFISYRNAYNVYSQAGGSYFGVTLPQQLKKDLLNTASKMGFDEDVEKYKTLFNEKLDSSNNGNGELILFMEEGNVPVKEENKITIFNAPLQRSWQYRDSYGNAHDCNFNNPQFLVSASKLSDLSYFTIALPYYKVVTFNELSKTILLNEKTFQPELVQNFNTLAVDVLKEHFINDLTKASIRFVAKRLMEKGVSSLTEKLAEGTSSKKNNQSKGVSDKKGSEKEKDSNAKLIGQTAGLIANIANNITEKADTRSWISLPAYISYIRVPLKAGENNINIQFNGKSTSLKVESKKGLQIRSVYLR